MAKRPQSFAGNLGQTLPGVHPDYRAIIRRYQPYRRGNGPEAIRWLRNLSNRDKHRILIPARISAGGMPQLVYTTSWPITRLEPLLSGRRAINVGTPLLRIHMLPTLNTECQMQVNGNVPWLPIPGLRKGAWPIPSAIRETVFEILNTFTKLL